MTEIIEVKNMEYARERAYTINGEQMNLRTMVLNDLDAARWNSFAERTNIKSFICMTGRQPVNYAEVKEWVNGLINGTKKAPVSAGAIQYA